MSPTRRSVLALLGGALATPAAARPALADARKPAGSVTGIDVEAYEVGFFSIRDPARRQFGALSYRSGLELQSRHEAFGGFSSLWRSPDGARLVAVTDRGHWLTGDVVVDGGRLSGLANAVIAPILGPDGKPLAGGRYYDVEGLTIVDGTAYVSIERVPAVMRFDFARHGVSARGVLVPLPAQARAWPRNRGPESIAIAPPASPLAGSLIIIAENARQGRNLPSQGLILTGARRGAFDVVLSNEYEITDAAFLPDGDLLLLERRFSILRGVAARIRRVPGDMLAPEAVLDGPVIFEADGAHQVDNMEGLSLHRGPQGETVVTLISDDNFSILQRTLLLEFVLAED